MEIYCVHERLVIKEELYDFVSIISTNRHELD
jgi:hypothetical protein